MNHETKVLKRLLKENGHYITKARLRLFYALQSNPALTINELIKKVSRHDQATVYRNILVFEELGVIARLRLGWESKLELSDVFRHHHHHLTCLKCGRVRVLPEDLLLEQRISQLSKKKSFKITDHQLEITGYCRNCH